MAIVRPNSKVPVGQRRARIRELLAEKQAVSIPDLAAMFGVSEMTVRRDLDHLERGGVVRRTHGGALAAERMVFEFDFQARRHANRRAKQAIARRARRLIEPGARIILDTGTTSLELAVLLRDAEDLTVITPSLAVASQLQFSPGIQTILLGGVLREGSPDLSGPVTEYGLEMLAADLAFQGADGIGLDGAVYNADLQLARVDQRMHTRADKTYILADSSKIGRTSLARMVALNEVEALITDAGIDPEAVRRFKKNGAKVIVCEA